MLLLLGLIVGVVAPVRAQLIQPDARWRVFETEHFRVTYPDGLEETARRAAFHAERAHALLSAEFLPPPRGRIELVVADNLDLANGVATPFPRNRIVAYAHPPSGEPYLAFYDDWLELLVLHELVHIFHLSDGGGVWPAVRSVLGRNPVAFPHAYTPGWLIEGLATFAESRFTAAGRVRGSMFEMILRTAVLADALEGIDHVTLEPATWPGGLSRYLLGAFFIDHLAGEFGLDAVTDVVRSTGRQLVPYRLDGVTREVLGISFSRAWEIWADSLRIVHAARADSIAAAGLTVPELLWAEGRIAEHPRYSPRGELAFVASTGRSEPSLLTLAAGDRPERRATIAGTGPGSWVRDTDRILFARLEFAGPHTLLSDLFEADPAGRVRRITRGARVWHPDVHPSRAMAIAVGEAAGTNVLVIVDLQTGQREDLTARDLDVQWAEPRWSPSGDRIAASRWQGGNHDVVIMDPSGGPLHRVTDDRAVASSPTWTPDGRYLLFSSDRTGVPNLYAFDTESGDLRQVTNVLTGAFHPAVSPDGQWIAFSYYRSDGYHIARIPFDPAGWRDPEPPAEFSERVPPTAGEVGGPVRRYTAIPYLLPTWWSPILDFGASDWTGVGLVTGSRDVVDRHAWALDAMVYPEERRGEWDLSYRYGGWGNPELILGVRQDWSRYPARRVDGVEVTPELARRSREAEVALSWSFRRWRRIFWLQGGAESREVDLTWRSSVGDDAASAHLRFPIDAGGFAAVGYSSVRRYDLSLSSQEGVRASVRAQASRYLTAPPGETAVRDYWRVTSRNAAFQGWERWTLAPAVFAFRLDAGVETRHVLPGFSVGGPSGSSSISVISPAFITRSSAYPIRGYPSGVQRGNRVVSGSLEFRFPLLSVERGYRLLPVAVDRIWGALFTDAGTAWCQAPCGGSTTSHATRPQPLTAVGAEAVVEVKLGYAALLPVRFGVAQPIRAVGDIRESQLYVRVGLPF